MTMKSNASKDKVEDYFELLHNLCKQMKLELITKLSNSINEDEVPKNENFIDRFFGAFKSDKSAEEIIKEIRESRTFNRTIESF